MGLTPMVSMLNAICDSGSQREVWFFYGVDNGDDYIMKERLEALEAEHENVHLRLCFSKPKEDEVEGEGFHHAGFVSVELFKQVLPSSNYDYYLCGPPPMVASLTTDLREWGAVSYTHLTLPTKA